MSQVHQDLSAGYVACLSPRLSTFIHLLFTCDVLHTHTACRKLWPVRIKDGTMNVWTYLYRITGQPSVLHVLAWSVIAKLCHTTSGGAQQRSECRTQSDGLFNEPLDSLNPQPPLHGLALTNFLDCNTRHVECSTCCVPRLGTRSPTNITNSCRGTEWKLWHRHKQSQTDKQGKYLIIYLNSLVLNLCLYTVNSATLQRISFKRKRWETLRDVKLNNLCCLFCT